MAVKQKLTAVKRTYPQWACKIGQAALQEDSGVESDDEVDAGGGVAGEDDAGEQEGDDVFAPKQRVAHLCSGGSGCRL